MRRQLQVGHQMLPVGTLGWTPEQWRTVADVMQREFVETCALIRRNPERLEIPLRLTASIQEAIARKCAKEPGALTCDAVRHIVAGLRRQGEHAMADQLADLFNTTPGYLAP